MFQRDENDRLWIASLGGLYCYDKQTQEVKGYTPSNSQLPGNIVYGILMDSRRRFWVGTNKGLRLFHPEEETFTVPALPGEVTESKIVEFIYEDGNGNLFFGTLDGRLFVSDADLTDCRTLFAQEGLMIENIIQDDAGYYWIGTDKGIVKADSDFKILMCCPHTEGIPELIANPGTASRKDKEGNIWMAGVKGLIVIDSHSEYMPAEPRIVCITANGEVARDINTTGITALALDNDKNNLTFRFMLKDYGNMASALLECRLEGHDTEWRPLPGRNEVTYFDLPAGNYKFQVRRLLSDASMASVSVSIKKALPARLWIPIAALLAAAAIGGLAFKLWRDKSFLTRLLPHRPAETESTDTGASKTVRNPKFTEEEMAAMALAVRQYMEEQKAYLNQDLKQTDVAAATGYSTQNLSLLFNQYLHVGYYDYVNAYRVEEFKRLVKEKGTYERFTLMTLAGKCGFKSQTSFFRTFKKFTGLTPNDYIHKLHED